MGEVARVKLAHGDERIEFSFWKSEVLQFKDLKVSDKFIIMPMPGDDAGHGGFKQVHWIFVKIKEVSHPLSDLKDNAKRLQDGGLVNITPNMEVIRVA